MHKKKILVYGTPDSLQRFFSDAVSRDFEVVALLGTEPEKFPVKVFAPQALPDFVFDLIDGIVFTNNDTAAANLLIKQGIAPRKIILWDAAQGWKMFGGQDTDGTKVVYFCGLEFHIRDKADEDFLGETVFRLQNQRQVKNLSPQRYAAVLAQIYQRRMGRPLDFNHLTTFTEKMQWLKLYDSTLLKSRLTDKYLVRRWVADKIGQEYLIPLLGVWNDFDDIDFNELPDQFVLKCNHGSGMNVIVRDKKTFDKQRAREKINAWLDTDFATMLLELHYTRIKRKIIAEKYIENMSDGVIDYKFHCFNGTPEFLQVIGDRDYAKHTRHQKFCDLDYNDIGAMFDDYPLFPYYVPKPAEFEKMKSFAKILSEGFSYVRVDFYEIDGKLLFGEMTFTSDAGYFPYKKTWTYEKDAEVGSLLTLPEPTPPPRFESGGTASAPCRS